MDSDAVRGAAAALFVDFFPLVLADVVRTHHPIGGDCFCLVTTEASALAPGFDDHDDLMTLMSAWVDLSGGPVAVRTPPTGGRFFSLTLLDAAGAPFASLGSRTGDDDGLELALVPPGWDGEPPRGLDAKRAPGDLVWVVSRIRARSPLDLAETLALATRQTLARPRAARPSPAPPVSLSSPPCPTSVRRALGVSPAIFFHRLGAILARTPDERRHRLRPRIAALSAALGGPPPAADWSAEFAAALTRGFTEAAQRIRVAAAPGDAGWRELGGGPSADVESLASAADALERLGAPMRDDIMSLVCDRDVDGLPLSGAESYRLRFPRGGLPPAQAFWRLAPWPPPSDNWRRVEGGLDPIPNADGSLDLILQREAPDTGAPPSWLPLPEGRFSLLMRLFAPGGEALAGVWRMPSPELSRASAADARRRTLQASE